MNLQSEPEPIGSPALFSRRDIVGTLLSLIKTAWGRVCANTQLNRNSPEPKVAGALFLEMKEEKTARNLKCPLLSEESMTRSRTGMLIGDGRIDLKVFYDFGEDDFLGLEYKNLHSTHTTLAGKYVSEGMMRFISAKYCPGHEIVSMAGFVMDAATTDTTGAVELITNEIDKQRPRLSMEEEWTVESSYTNAYGSDPIYRTKHTQPSCSVPFTMLHLILPYIPAAPIIATP